MAHRALLLGSLLTACTNPAEHIELEDDAAIDWRAGAILPDGQQVAAKARVVPTIEPEATPSEPELGGPPRIRVQFDPETCWPSFTAPGFPAIDLETRRVAVPLAHSLQLSPAPGSLDLVWFDADSGAEIERDMLLHDEEYAPGYDESEPQRSCHAFAAPIRKRVRAANEKLRAHAWVAMESLPVELYYGEYDNSDAAYRELKAPRERPVQVLVQHGQAIARVLGVKVLERDRAPRGMSLVHAVYAHRNSGTVLFATRDCDGESCTCDPRSDAVVLHWSPETFATIDAKPCVPEPRTEGDEAEFGDQDTCDLRALPFEDSNAPLWEV